MGGHPDYQTPEQVLHPEFQTTERVPERNIGAFAGWPTAIDWYGWIPSKWENRGIMHCCTGNAARTISYVWENVLHHQDGKLRVNLLLNRASPWADVDSHIPYEGMDCRTCAFDNCREAERCGIDEWKRSRLIQAGAHVIMPDFREWDVLTRLLWNESAEVIRAIPRL